MDLVDELIPIGGDEAIATSHALASKEGIFTGISGGATVAVALQASSGSLIHPSPNPDTS